MINIHKQPWSIRYFVKVVLRSFLGVYAFLESDFAKKLVEGYFRQLEWSLVISAILAVGLKLSGIVLVIGVVGVILMFWHSFVFWLNELQAAWLLSLDQVNRDNLQDLFLPFYKSSSIYSLTALTIILVAFFVFNLSLVWLTANALVSI